MNEQQDKAASPTAETDSFLQWWQHQWLESAHPLARMQLAWMVSLADAMQFEAQFLHTLAESGQKMARNFDAGSPQTAAEMQTRYRKLMEEVTDAHMARLQKAAELSDEFRQRIWEEL